MQESARPGDGRFEPFPKPISTDAVSYQIFAPHVIDTARCRSQLRDILRVLDDVTKVLVSDGAYVWHREAFKVQLSSDGPQAHLAGRTEFADSLADEWLIVYLLRELSIKRCDSWIRICDVDGEFLLIEAANALPKWLEPEVASHRVWLNQGRMLIIPPSLDPPSDSTVAPHPIDLPEALNFIRERPDSLVYHPHVEAEAFYRLRKYPQQIQDSVHTGGLVLPRKLAYILHEAPLTISFAVEAFCQYVSSRPESSDSHSGRHFPGQDLVQCTARFNRTSFAQLKCLDIRLPQSWLEVPERQRTDDMSRLESGAKLALGYDWLLESSLFQNCRAAQEVVLLLNELDEDITLLPTDEIVASWSRQEDSETWLDVDYTDFDNVLSGKAKQHRKATFNDRNTEDMLNRIVENFGSLLESDEGSIGSEDLEDEAAIDGQSVHSREDRAAAVDDDHFRSNMQRMIDSPSRIEVRVPQSAKPQSEEVLLQGEEPGIEEEPSVQEVEQMTEALQAELKHEGVLDADDPEALRNALEDESLDGEDARTRLAKNFLASLRGQADTGGLAKT